MTGHHRAGSLLTGKLGLHTDLYELRMVDSYLREQVTAPATFSLYIRPTVERPWFVAHGMHRVTELIESYRFGEDELAYLAEQGFGDPVLAYLSALEPSGEIWAVEEGTVVLAQEPLLEVTAPLPFAQLIEPAVMNLVQLPTLVATKAARIALAATDASVVDFGFRRAHGLETGVEAALAAYVGGGMATSNVEAGRRFEIPIVGTMAHSYIQAHSTEAEAFRNFFEHHPEHSTLLVDTYDTLEGVRNAITVADGMRDQGHALRGVRLDSGDLAALARETRRLLDEAGYHDTAIFASGGLNEWKIHELVRQDAPIDAYGVGTDLVTSLDRAAVDIAYKLVAYDGRPVRKLSEGKTLLPGPKQVFRTEGPSSDVLACRDESLGPSALLSPMWRDGSALRRFEIASARERVMKELAELPERWRLPPYVEPPPEPEVSAGLRSLEAELGGAADPGRGR